MPGAHRRSQPVVACLSGCRRIPPPAIYLWGAARLSWNGVPEQAQRSGLAAQLRNRTMRQLRMAGKDRDGHPESRSFVGGSFDPRLVAVALSRRSTQLLLVAPSAAH